MFPMLYPTLSHPMDTSVDVEVKTGERHVIEYLPSMGALSSSTKHRHESVKPDWQVLSGLALKQFNAPNRPFASDRNWPYAAESLRLIKLTKVTALNLNPRIIWSELLSHL